MRCHHYRTSAARLTAARVLDHKGHSIIVLEARNRKRGPAFSNPLKPNGNSVFNEIADNAIAEDTDPNIFVELGRSSIHGVHDDGNSMWSIAIYHDLFVPQVLDGVARETKEYENILVSPWFYNGNRISHSTITRMNRLRGAIITRISGYAERRAKNLGNDNLAAVYARFRKDVLETLEISIADIERQILTKMCNLYLAYCVPMSEQSAQDIEYNDGYFDEHTILDDGSIKKDAMEIDKFLLQAIITSDSHNS